MKEVSRERRKFPRIPTDQVISFAPVEYPNEHLAVSTNVSAGGIRFEAVGCELELGDTIRVTFNIGDHTVVAVCEVCWATELDTITSDIGLSFLEIDPTALQLIEENTEAYPSI
jgi:hypothetical protein